MRNTSRTRTRAALIVAMALATAASTLAVGARRDASAQTTTMFSLWSSSVMPGTPATDDASPVTVGVKFRTDVAGFATGVRFYKGAGNSGTPGTGWTGFTPVSTSGASIGRSSRYLQYRITLSTTDRSQTPVVRDFTVRYGA